jgi:hypothetical protein
MTGRSHPNARATGGKVPQFLEIGQARADLVVRSRAPNITKFFAVAAQTFEETTSEFRRDYAEIGLANTPNPVHSTSCGCAVSRLFVIFLANTVNESLIVSPK